MRGGGEKASRKGDRGEEERPANGDCDSNTEKGERGRGGTGEEREGSVHCPKKWKRCVHQGMSEQEEREGVKREERQEGRGQVESEPVRGLKFDILPRKGAALTLNKQHE